MTDERTFGKKKGKRRERERERGAAASDSLSDYEVEYIINIGRVSLHTQQSWYLWWVVGSPYNKQALKSTATNNNQYSWRKLGHTSKHTLKEWRRGKGKGERVLASRNKRDGLDFVALASPFACPARELRDLLEQAGLRPQGSPGLEGIPAGKMLGRFAGGVLCQHQHGDKECNVGHLP